MATSPFPLLVRRAALLLTLCSSNVIWWSCIATPILEAAPDVDYAFAVTGGSTGCGLTTEGQIFCWTRRNPRPGLLTSATPFSQLSLSVQHACGVATDDMVYCWGLDSFGELGLGSDDAVSNCTMAATGLQCGINPVSTSETLKFVTVQVGHAHSCALTADGTAYCWGSNINGQLGVAVENDCFLDVVEGGLPCARTPVAVPDLRFRAITTGSYHTCALDLDGAAYCWGAGGSGRLGTGDRDDRVTPTAVAGDWPFASISAGGTHTCAVTTDGRGYCWGSNSDMQLGRKDTELTCGRQLDRCFTTPIAVAADYRFASLTASDGAPLATIGGHTCGLTTDARVLCWGLNESGQLANSSDIRSSRPVPVSDELRFLQISAGVDNTCGVTTERRIVCWARGGPANSWYTFQ